MSLKPVAVIILAILFQPQTSIFAPRCIAKFFSRCPQGGGFFVFLTPRSSFFLTCHLPPSGGGQVKQGLLH